MSALASYRALLSLTGPGYVLGTFLARLPLAMSQLGVLLLVSDSADSYGAGGASAGALAVANGLTAPAWGALADRIGQRPVLVAQSLGGAAGFAAILLLTDAGASWGWVAVACAAAGVMMPQVGPMSRIRWRPIAAGHPREDRLVQTAFSYEGAADEAAFVIGPALIGVGVSLLSPTAALVGAGVLLGVFGTWFALHPTAPPAHDRPASAGNDEPLWSLPLALLCLSQLVIGTIFGSVQTGTSVLATAAGHPGATGFLHALLGVGSVIAGLTVAALPDRFGLADRLRWFALGLFLLSAPLLLVGSVLSLVPVLLVLGVSVAPYMITTFTLGEQITPPWRLASVMTQLAAATVLGYALGASIAGQVADLGGHRPAYAVTVAAAAVAVLVSWSGRRTLERARRP
ncbi:MFS transporter [Nocardioides daejeonensis]|uniref:MFS transporter n=1 Tax=Nocardioides daejeonensis TaxID=1046556 RepID=UPI000D743838|nr:MFS transporter [Nocardioides daejeonensis]